MTPEQYAQFHKYLPILTHVWNTVPDSDTGITPFEAEHGMKCKGIAECILEEPPAEGLPATADDLKSIAVSAKAFMQIINHVKTVEKSLAAIRLNEDGSSKIKFEIGDQAPFYLPPDSEAAKKMRKKPKHILQYSGPAVIEESLSPNGTSFRIKYQGRNYNRNIMHINRYKAVDQVPAALQLIIDHTVSVGSYVAVLDEHDAPRYHLAQVIDITNQNTTLHYMGTKSSRLRDAKWVKLYHHPGSGEVVMYQPRTLVRNWTRYTGVIDTREREDSLIILPNVGLTDRARINVASRNALARFPQTHHVVGRTWFLNR